VSPDRYDQDTTVQGANKRYAREVPPLDPTLKPGFRDYVRAYVRKWFKPLGDVMSFEEWLDSESYSSSRKEQIRRAHDKWMARGGIPTQKELSRVKAHIKLESYPQYKHARHINARCDLAKALFGPIIKSMERVVYGVDHHFIKHVPLPDRPALLRGLKFSGAKYIATDHTAFEAHFTVELQEIVEFELINWMLSRIPHIAKVVRDTESGENRIVMTSTGFYISIAGIRCSGDMWTSLFNGFGNLMSIGYACELKHSTFDGYVEGDDGIFAVMGEVPTPADMTRLGFEVKIEEHSDPATASFCGMILAGDQIIRDPRSFFQKFGWTDRAIWAGRKLKRRLALAKALSALYETPHNPLTAVAARYVYERTRGVEPLWDTSRYRQVPKDFHPPPTQTTDETRQLFQKLYGVSPETQRLMEKQIATGDWTCLSNLNYHPDVAHYVARFVDVT